MLARVRFEALPRYCIRGRADVVANLDGTLMDRDEVFSLAEALDAERAQSSGQNLADMVDEATTTAMAKRNSGLEELVKAFLADTGASAAACVLVEQMDGNALTWRIEHRPASRPCGCPSTGPRCYCESDE